MQREGGMTKRRRGGQPGNTNRLIHGLYSKRLARPISSPPNSLTGHDPDFEIALARVHLAQLLTAQKAAPAHQWLAYERAVIDCLGLIVSLISAYQRKHNPRVMGAGVDTPHRYDIAPPGLGPSVLNLIRTWPEDDSPLS